MLIIATKLTTAIIIIDFFIGGYRKLNFLLTQPPFPAETFSNLLILYIKHQYYDLAADVLAENTHLHESFLEPVLLKIIFIISSNLNISSLFFISVLKWPIPPPRIIFCEGVFFVFY